MFRKVTTVTNLGPVTALKKQIEFATATADEFYGIRYYDVESLILEALYALIPKEWHNDFYSSLLVINDNIPPHTDIVETAGLNCYIEPGSYTTTFYSNAQNASGIEYADHGEGHIYNADDLTPLGSFLAEPFDVYLINNKVIHGVTNNLNKPIRRVLQLATNKHSFDEVVDKLTK